MTRIPAPAVLDTDDLRAVADLVRSHCGLVVDVARYDVLAGLVRLRGERIGVRREPGRSEVAGYLEHVRADPAELQALVEGLTIGETYFARIPPQMQALSELVLPALLRQPDRRLRIWCAGCSTGEEPYTVALLLAKLLAETAARWDIEILGTDINSAALDAARCGRYGMRSVGLLDDADLDRYFVRDGDGWRVGDQLRQWVRLRQHNLAAQRPPAGQLDLILCRNVMIYFDRPAMRRVVEALHAALAPGGWLLHGHSETLWRVHDGFELVRHGDAFLYRRRPKTLVPRQSPTRSAAAVRTTAARPAQIQLDTTLGTELETAVDTTIEIDVVPATERIQGALAIGAYAAAADLAKRAAADAPLVAQLHYLHGLALVELNRDDDALSALRRAAYLDPNAGFAQFLLAVVLGRLGHAAEAARAYGIAARTLQGRPCDERVAELGDRRVEDLVAICHRLAASRPPAVMCDPGML
jgi:chemotaxis protein methyltransferase CheR